MPEEIPDIPIRTKLRPCCAFGNNLKIRVGALPVPGFRIGNIMGLEELGPHIYDSGAFTISSSQGIGRRDRSRERNGLIYTCRGGFIDTAHVRDYVDWTLFLATEIIRNIEIGGVIEFPDEGGQRRVVLKPVDSEFLDLYGRARVGIRLAEYIGFELSVWHEIATWYGWSWVSTFPETASAFSPEDLYSNILGAKIAMVIAHRRMAVSEHVFNRSASTWIDSVIEHLEPVSREVGIDAMQAVDQFWWDSNRRLPDKELTLRRNLEARSNIVPWLVPPERMPASLERACGEEARPIEIAHQSGVLSIRFADWIELEIEVDEGLATQEPFVTQGRRIVQSDFPAIIKAIRGQNRVEFGPAADQPD